MITEKSMTSKGWIKQHLPFANEDGYSIYCFDDSSIEPYNVVAKIYIGKGYFYTKTFRTKKEAETQIFNILKPKK